MTLLDALLLVAEITALLYLLFRIGELSLDAFLEWWAAGREERARWEEGR